MRGVPNAAVQTQGAFRTTRWSLVLRASDRREPGSQQALTELYETYWYPLYAYARRRGVAPDSAADLIQGFFAELLGGTLFQSADVAKGRFRSYLLGALKHFMSGQWERSCAQKRGGGRRPVPLDDAESRYGLEPAHGLTSERLFERGWALTLLDQVFEQLAREYAQAGKQKQFEHLRNLIAGPLPDRTYAEVGQDLAMSEGAVKVAVHRLRQRYREILCSHIADTVATADEIEDEIRHLHTALAVGV